MKFRLLLYIFIVLFTSSSNTPDLFSARNLYVTSADNEADYLKLFDLTLDYNLYDYPVLYGYAAAATFIQAEYVFLPSSKLKCVDKGRKMLEEVIKLHPNNIELRFIRLSIQKELPFFIDYKSDIDADKTFLANHVKDLNDLELQKLINYYL